MRKDDELYRRQIKMKSEENLMLLAREIERHLADRFDRIAEGTEDVEVPESLDQKLLALLESIEEK